MTEIIKAIILLILLLAFFVFICFIVALIIFGKQQSRLPTLKEAENEQAKIYFKGICPYTGKKCEDWECHKCEVEAEERKYMENDSEE